ncbi:MAG: response regulator [Planctomycetota bacterium]|jgi:DNA-binding response OmpR family regulator
MQEITRGERRILIAEKDQEVRHLLSEFLVLQGYDVVEVDAPGRVPLEKIGEPFDLFLLGHGKSEEETFEALLSVRESATCAGVPVIVIAVEPDEGFLMKAVSRGADSLLPFPFPMEVLQEKIEDLLDGRRTPLMP